MNKNSASKVLLLVLFCGLTLLISCGSAPKRVVWVGESDPLDFSLSNTRPESFAFELPSDEKGPFDFAFELTYFDNQLQGWDALPLYYTLQYPDGKEEDKRFSIRLKDEKGEWRGQLKENMTDRVLEETVNGGLPLLPGKYLLKLYGDSKDLARPILGIVHVAFKVYSN